MYHDPVSDHAGQNGNGHVPTGCYRKTPEERRERRETIRKLLGQRVSDREICKTIAEQFDVSVTMVRRDLSLVYREWRRIGDRDSAREFRRVKATADHLIRMGTEMGDFKGGVLIAKGLDIITKLYRFGGDNKDDARPVLPATMSEWTRAADELARRPEEGEEVKRIEATVVEERKEAKT